MPAENQRGPSRKLEPLEADPPSRGSLARFLVICFFAAAVAVVLGLYFIQNLFDARGRLNPPQVDWRLSAVAGAVGARPPNAANQLLVFFTKDGASLTPVPLPLKGEVAPEERARLALEALFRGPSHDLYASPVPSGTYLRAFYLHDAEQRQAVEAVIDVSRDIMRQPLGGFGAELLCVYAIVNTALANCETADCARILVDGSPLKGVLWNDADLSGPLVPGAMIASPPSTPKR